MKAKSQDQEREANGEIARIGSLLKGLDAQESDLTASILSLGLVINALGKIKTTFEHTYQFWLSVEKQCNKLSNQKDLITLGSDVDFKDEFISELKDSGLNWLSLGKINYIAMNAIRQVDEVTDNILCNLPTKMEALELVNKSDLNDLFNSIENENKAIKA